MLWLHLTGHKYASKNMPTLQLRDPGVLRARYHPALRGKPALARGEFSAIFEGSRPDTVLKLTADASHYAYMTDGYAPDGPHKPELIADLDEVGEAATGETLYLLEVERLAPVRKQDEYTRAVRRTMRAVRGARIPESVWEDQKLPPSLAAFFQSLNWFAVNFGYCIDAKFGSNYLCRPCDGTLVASDPVFDQRAMRQGRNPSRPKYR